MEITGRLTADATVAKTKADRQVVNFSIAINDSFKSKDTGELKKITTYIHCSYWLSIKPADWLKKGALVQLYGRIGLNVYNNMDGKAVGSLNFHVSNIKVLVSKRTEEENATATAFIATTVTPKAANDDLPF